MQSYRKEIYTETRKRLTNLAILVSIVLVVSLTSLFLLIENFQLNQDTEKLENHYQSLKESSFDKLALLNRGVISQFLNHTVNERQLYRTYYDQVKSISPEANLLVIDEMGQVAFSTGRIEQKLSPYYLKVVINKSSHQDLIKIQRDAQGKKYILFFSKIANTTYHSILVIEEEIFNRLTPEYGTQFILADKYDNSYVKNTQLFIEGDLKKVDSSKLKSFYVIENDNLYINQFKRLDDSVYLYTFLMTFPVKFLILFSLFVLIVMLSFFTVQSNRLAKSIADKNTKEIDSLSKELLEVKSGSQTKIKMATNIEFQFLIDNINDMVIERDKLLKQQLSLERQNYVYEKKVLESQFNPHFIYNTLETIRVTSHFDPGIADKLILSLNRVLRYSVDFTSNDTCLVRDLDIIQDFLEVNFIRFEKFTYQVKVESNLKSLLVPKLFLLPIVENSIKYGMGVRNDLSIKINGYLDKDKIILDVTDNGPGFSNQIIQSIHQMKVSSSQTHHGIINSYRRLKMSYPQSEIVIINHLEGATVRFIIWGEKND